MRTLLDGRKWQMGLLLALGLLSAALLPATLSAQISPGDLLPVDEAFALEHERVDDAIVLTWTIEPGYYLYRHAFDVQSEDVELGEPQLPTGEITTDEFFGQTETYRDRVTMVVPILDEAAGTFSVQVVSQGCADLGVCYPPNRQQLSIDPVVAKSTSDPQSRPSSSLSSNLSTNPSTNPPTGTGSLSDLLGNNGGALPATEAFRIEAIATDSDVVLVRIGSVDGYYVYRDSLDFSTNTQGVEVIGHSTPEASPIFDEYFGDTWVFFGEVEIPVRLSRTSTEARGIDFVIDFQGCLTDGICYPPMSRTIAVDLPAGDLSTDDFSNGLGDSQSVEDNRAAEGVAAGVPIGEQDRLAQALSQTPLLALALFLLAGILLAFTPCVFPMVPILSGLIAGQGDEINTARAFRLSVIYVLSMALVYTAFGVVAGVFGQNLQAVFQHPVVLISFSILFVVLSLAMFGFYELQLPSSVQTKLNELSNRQEGGTWMGAAIMGALSALVVGPCVAPALMGALIYIGQTGDAVLGGAALFAMAIGMGIPLVIWGTSAGRWLPRAGGWMNAVKAVFGVGLLALAIWMLERILPASVVMALWGSLLIACAVYLGALTRLEPGGSGWPKLWQALGVILLILGVVQWLGALTGGRDWTRPLGHWSGGTTQTIAAPQFVEVENLAQLNNAIDSASLPVFLDFYADWCVDCIRMERRTFVDSAVANRMGEFALIKVDVTDYNEDHKAILGHFDLIGPPAMLFFANGTELIDQRRFGFMAPEVFVGHLDQVMTTAGQGAQSR